MNILLRSFLVGAIGVIALQECRVHAQIAPKIQVAVSVQVRGKNLNDGAESQFRSYIRRELESIRDVEVLLQEQPPKPVIDIVGVVAGDVYAMSVLVTERYDRDTLRFIGVTDDETAKPLLVLTFQMGHWVFTGTDLSEIAKRIVASIDGDTFEKSRKLLRP